MKPAPAGPVVLGVDPGSHNTGYAFLTSFQGKAQVLAYEPYGAMPKKSFQTACCI